MAELLARISSRELTEWMAHEQINGPLDLGRRGDYHAAQITAAIVNANRGKKPPVPAEKFLQRWDPAPRTPDELYAIALQVNAQLGGTHDRG